MKVCVCVFLANTIGRNIKIKYQINCMFLCITYIVNHRGIF